MATADTGLFGPTPWEIQQAQQQALQTQAANYAQQSPLQRAAQGMFTAGGQLGGMGAQALGGVNVAQQQAAQNQQALQGADLQTPEGLRAAAKKMLEVGNQKSAYLLGQKAAELEKEQAATALAQRKQDFMENEALQLKKDQLAQAAELKKAQLEQAAEAARLRSEDRQASTQQRADAAAEANATKLQIAQLMAEMKRMGIEAKQSAQGVMTPAQAFKQKQAEAKSSGQLRGMDNSFENLTSAANKIVNHPGLDSATGLSSLVWSRPGGEASQVENLLSEFKSGVKKTGLDLVRQGGGIGAMSEKEWPIVEGMVAEIDPKAGKDAVVSQINKVLAKVDQVRQNAYQTHNEGFDAQLALKPIGVPPAVPVPGKPVTPAPAQVNGKSPIYATNGKVRIMSTDGGVTWVPAGAK